MNNDLHVAACIITCTFASQPQWNDTYEVFSPETAQQSTSHHANLTDRCISALEHCTCFKAGTEWVRDSVAWEI